MTDALGKFLDGLNEMYEKDILKVEKEFKRKLTKQEKELVADNFLLRLKNHMKK